MPTKQLGPFRGIDARPGAADKAGGLLEALNVIVAADGGLVRRPALTARATLPADSKGLYAVGDQLRTLAPYQITASTTTSGTNNVGGTQLNVVTTTGFPASGFVTTIDGDVIREYPYASKTGTAFIFPTVPTAVVLVSTLVAGKAVRYDDCAQDNDLTPTIYVDYITDPTPDTLDTVLGTIIGSDGRSISLTRYANRSTAIHRSPLTGEPPQTDTLVPALGFTPDFSIVRAAGRAFALDATLRYLRYSAVDSANPDRLLDFGQTLYPVPDTDPIVYTTSVDQTSGAGFLEVSQFASGAGSPQGLALFGGRMVVLYRSALLIYRIDVDQSRFFLEQQITGPGTSAPRSVAELGADTIFLSEAGVRVISTVMQTLDAREDAIGGRIDHLAKQFAANDTITPVGCYSRRLGCYLLAFGQDVLCLGVLPGSAILGWTRWRLPVPVDAWAESSGLQWMRSGTTLYAFEDGEDQDETSLGVYVNVPVLVETLPMRGTTQNIATAVSAAATEPIMVQVVADGRPGVDNNGAPIGLPITLPPRAPEPARAILSKLGRTFSVRVYDEAAVAGWRLDNLWLDVDPVRA
jgi:hypothetical protein